VVRRRAADCGEKQMWRMETHCRRGGERSEKEDGEEEEAGKGGGGERRRKADISEGKRGEDARIHTMPQAQLPALVRTSTHHAPVLGADRNRAGAAGDFCDAHVAALHAEQRRLWERRGLLLAVRSRRDGDARERRKRLDRRGG
jgi:hypothetical protein